MADSGFLTFDEYGLYCKAGDFYLDPQKPVLRAVISHAHGDHACPGNMHVYCTPGTADVMKLRLKKNAGLQFYPFPYGETFEVNGVGLTFYPAGHIMGSAQVLLEHGGCRYLYTGDFKLQEDDTCERFEFVKADVLITESTFANPEVKHPGAEGEIARLNDFKHNVLLGAYALGKSQRLTRLINTYCPGRKVLLHHSIMPLARLYESHSFKLGPFEAYNRKLMKMPDSGLVYIVPPLTFNCYYRATGVLRAFASGWKRLQQGNDIDLYISDHADWDDILHTIKQVEPAEIWTLHGDGRYISEHFSARVPVKSLC